MTNEELKALEDAAHSPFASLEDICRYADASLAEPALSLPQLREAQPQQPSDDNLPVTRQEFHQALDAVADLVGQAIGRIDRLMADESRFTRETLKKLGEDVKTQTANELATLRASVSNKPWKSQRREQRRMQ